MNIRQADIADLERIAAVARANVNELGFILRAQLEEGIKRREIIIDDDSSAWAFAHTRKDEQTTLYYIAVPMVQRGKGIGRALLNRLPRPLRCKCPFGLPANRFYQRLGFKFIGFEPGKKRKLCLWRLDNGTESSGK